MADDKSPIVFHRVTATSIEPMHGVIIGESRWALFVNDSFVVALMATPNNLHHLALGFLLSENLITSLETVASIRVNLAPDRAYWFIPALSVDAVRSISLCEEGVGSIHVRLTQSLILPERRTITSGCGGGLTFDDLSQTQPPLESQRTVRAARLFELMRELNARATLYRECRGVHTSGLSDGEQLIFVAEDVGRHNTLDKIRGACLMQNISTQDKLILTTGRISAEMITKAAKMQTPIVITRTSPTHLALELARAWNITLIGYLRGGQMQVYHGIERIQIDA